MPAKSICWKTAKIRRDFLYPPGELFVDARGKIAKNRARRRSFICPTDPFVGGVQWHGPPADRPDVSTAIPTNTANYTDKELLQFVRSVKAAGGAVTINVPIDVETGHIPATATRNSCGCRSGWRANDLQYNHSEWFFDAGSHIRVRISRRFGFATV